MKEKNQKDWYERELKSREGKIILPLTAPTKKYEIKKGWLKGLKPHLYFKEEGVINSTLNEMMYSIFAQSIGLDVVKVRPAELVGQNKEIRSGMLVEAFISNSKTQKAYSARDLREMTGSKKENTIKNHIQILKNLQQKYAEKGKKLVIDSKLVDNLFKMALADFLFLNTDRHGRNINYIIEKRGEKEFYLTVSKTFDNSLTLGYDIFQEHSEKFGQERMLERVRSQIRVMRFTVYKFENILYDKITDYSDQLAQFISQNPHMLKTYKKAINFDFDSLKQEVVKDAPGFKINQRYFKFAKAIFEETRQIMMESFDKYQTKKPELHL